MSILCRLGWHSWKPVMRWERFPGCIWGMVATAIFTDYGAWVETGHKCRRCGARK